MSFIGCDFPENELDAAAICFVDTKHLRIEAELFRSKWWDYKLVHPLIATYMFAHEYKKAIKAGLRVRSDLYKAANYKGLKHEDFLQTSKTTITGMWKARQRADQEGIPYEFWCRSAMRFAEERCWKYLPKPTQLYSDKPYVDSDVSMTSYIISRWRTSNLESFMFAESEFYKYASYAGHGYQNQHMKWVLDRLELSRFRPASVATVLEQGFLPEAALLAKLGQGEGSKVLARARRFLD